MKRAILFFMVMLSCGVAFASDNSVCFYSYDEAVLRGDACAEQLANDEIELIFTIHNRTRDKMDLKRAGYHFEKKDGTVYKLKSPVVIYHEDGEKDNSVLNPGKVAQVKVECPFRLLQELKAIKWFYVKDLVKQKRVFFVPFDKIEEYQKGLKKWFLR